MLFSVQTTEGSPKRSFGFAIEEGMCISGTQLLEPFAQLCSANCECEEQATDCIYTTPVKLEGPLSFGSTAKAEWLMFPMRMVPSGIFSVWMRARLAPAFESSPCIDSPITTCSGNSRFLSSSCSRFAACVAMTDSMSTGGWGECTWDWKGCTCVEGFAWGCREAICGCREAT